jgi:transposase
MTKRLREAVKKEKAQFKEGEKNGCSTITTLPHISSPLITQDFLAKHNTFVPQPPYSPHLAPTEFF